MKTVFEDIGGKAVIARVAKVFYDLVFQDPWIGQYFADVKQETIEAQQTDFMTQALGGPKVYCGRFPIPAHKHMFISEELFIYRENLVKKALDEVGIAPQLQEAWLNIDRAFKNGIVKKSVDQCEKRFNTDEILNFENPKIKKAA